MEQLKKIDGGVVVAGDGRHDSMGHSAKFCAYTMFCSTVPMIIHFDIVQVWMFIKCTSYVVQVGNANSNATNCVSLHYKVASFDWNLISSWPVNIIMTFYPIEKPSWK